MMMSMGSCVGKVFQIEFPKFLILILILNFRCPVWRRATRRRWIRRRLTIFPNRLPSFWNRMRCVFIVDLWDSVRLPTIPLNLIPWQNHMFLGQHKESYTLRECSVDFFKPIDKDIFMVNNCSLSLIHIGKSVLRLVVVWRWFLYNCTICSVGCIRFWYGYYFCRHFLYQGVMLVFSLICWVRIVSTVYIIPFPGRRRTVRVRVVSSDDRVVGSEGFVRWGLRLASLLRDSSLCARDIWRRRFAWQFMSKYILMMKCPVTLASSTCCILYSTLVTLRQ